MVWSLLFVQLAVVCAEGTGKTIGPETRLEEVIQATVSIRVTPVKANAPVIGGSEYEGQRGTGFFIDDDLILTNEHVTRGTGSVRISIQLSDNRDPVDGWVCRSDRSSDLALIKLSAPLADPKPRPLSLCERGDDQVLPLMAVGVVGVANSIERFLPTTGTLTSRITFAERPEYQTAREYGQNESQVDKAALIWLLDLFHPVRGMSGAPVFDGRGLIVGLFTGEIFSPRRPDDRFYFCISADRIRDFRDNRDLGNDLVPPHFQANNFAAKPVRPISVIEMQKPPVRTRQATENWQHVATLPRYAIPARSPSWTDLFTRTLFGYVPVTLNTVSTLVRNDAFAYAVVVPPGFQLRETLDPEKQILTSVYEKIGVGNVRITAQKVKWPWSYSLLDNAGNSTKRSDGKGMLVDRSMYFRRYTLNLYQEGLDDRPETYEDGEPRLTRETADAVVKLGWLEPWLSDPTDASGWGISRIDHSFYRYNHYEVVGSDRSIVVLSDLSDDNFITIDFEVPTRYFHTELRTKKALLERGIFPISLIAYPTR
jgi:hypothetical protein